jgi:Kef-type K+ transport system membrane component KefB
MTQLLRELRFPVVFLIACTLAGYVSRTLQLGTVVGFLLGGSAAAVVILLHNKGKL